MKKFAFFVALCKKYVIITYSIIVEIQEINFAP